MTEPHSRPGPLPLQPKVSARLRTSQARGLPRVASHFKRPFPFRVSTWWCLARPRTGSYGEKEEQKPRLGGAGDSRLARRRRRQEEELRRRSGTGAAAHEHGGGGGAAAAAAFGSLSCRRSSPAEQWRREQRQLWVCAGALLLLGLRQAFDGASWLRLRDANSEVLEPLRRPARHAPQVRGAALLGGVEPIHRPAQGLPGERAVQIASRAPADSGG